MEPISPTRPTLCVQWLTKTPRLPLYEDPDQILLKDHNEQLCTINIWSVIVDRCLQTLSGITLRRQYLPSYLPVLS